MIGNLNHRVTLEKRISIANGRGGFTFDYDKVGEFWAGVDPLNDFEVIKYREQGLETNVRVIMRKDPTPSRRPALLDRLILYHGVTVEIVGAIDTLDNGDYIEMLGVTRR